MLERFIKEVRRGTKVRDNQFPKPSAVEKLLYLQSEGFMETTGQRRLKGFGQIQEELERLFAERYPPTQTSTQNT